MSRYDQHKSAAKNPHEETIFDRMLTNNLKRREQARKEGQDVKPLKFEDMADESAMILNGGTEPPANEMAYATYYFLQHAEVRRRILEELDCVETDENGRLPLRKVENLPYFVRSFLQI
jgi:cytochrome P450